jgi:hypothetical protein
MAGRRKWSLENVQEVANTFRTRKEFRLEARQAYNAAHRYGWMNRVCSHMERERKDWTFEECQEVARRYNCRSAFMLDSNAAYQSAYRKGWLDRICDHM